MQASSRSQLAKKLGDSSRTRGRAMRPERPAAYVPARPRTPAYNPAKAVGSFVPKLTQKAFEKYGFSAATLLTDWAKIAGEALASYTAPERLKWPRGVETYGEVDETSAGRPGAMLILRVDPARALDVEYKAAQIVERINVYFGYRAVAELKVLQAPVGAATGNRQPAAGTLAAKSPATPAAMDFDPADPLQAALARMEAGIQARAASPAKR